MDKFFSERELGKKEPTTEEISLSAYNGIISVFKKYQKCFSENFPECCPDNNEMVYGVDISTLSSYVMAIIPGLKHLDTIYKDKKLPDKYAILDFIEFCYENIEDYQETDYHSYWGHYHLKFPNTSNNKNSFTKEINKLFERNRILFYLDENGKINRHLPIELNNIIQDMIIKTEDPKLNELINIAVTSIKSPGYNERIIALEKIWDAFERMKTFYSEKKKQSANKLIEEVGNKTEQFDELLDEEFLKLTEIGNKYQIRHFEIDKIEINDLNHIDYLFYRMIALIGLCIDSLNIKN